MGITVNTSPQQITASVGETKIDVSVGGGVGPTGATGPAGPAGSSYTLPTATASVLGGVKIGSGITIDGSGVISASAGYTLPTATASVLGGVKIGSGISIDGNGVISASSGYTLPTATNSVLGGVKIGSGVTITDGVISVSTNYAATSHSHGTLTSDGKLGTVSGQIVVTGSGGLVGTASSITPGQVVTETTYTNFLPEGGSLATALSGIDSALTGKAAAAHASQHAADGSDEVVGLLSRWHGKYSQSYSESTGYPLNAIVEHEGSLYLHTNAGPDGNVPGDSSWPLLAGYGIAAALHAHGAITSDGKVGSTAGLVLKTGTAGAVEALAQGTAGQVLKVNSGANGVEWGAAAADVSIDTTAADILSASSGSITADDPGADRLVFWDDSAGKLTYLSAGTNITITDTTISAAGSTSASDLTSGTLGFQRLPARVRSATSLYLWSSFR